MVSTTENVNPLTPSQQEALLDCYSREQNNIEPVVDCSYNLTFELIELGMLSAKTIIKNKKAMYGFYVTQIGIDYLSRL